MSSPDEETIGGLPTMNMYLPPKNDLWCHFFEIF
jgi:hypothetical protein